MLRRRAQLKRQVPLSEAGKYSLGFPLPAGCRLQDPNKGNASFAFEQNHPALRKAIIEADGTTSRLWRGQLLLGEYFISAGHLRII